jgi:hypothetical protein
MDRAKASPNMHHYLTGKYHPRETHGPLDTIGRIFRTYSMSVRMIQRSNAKSRGLNKFIQFDPPVRTHNHVTIQDNEMIIGSIQKLGKTEHGIQERMAMLFSMSNDPGAWKECLEILL